MADELEIVRDGDRFALRRGEDELGHLRFRSEDGVVVFEHSEIDQSLRGQGKARACNASALLKAMTGPVRSAQSENSSSGISTSRSKNSCRVFATGFSKNGTFSIRSSAVSYSSAIQS